MPRATGGAFDWPAGCVIRHGWERMENRPFDSCGLVRFPCSFYFKSLPVRQRVRITQPGITASVITSATKPSIKRSKCEAGFPVRWSASGRNGRAGFSLGVQRAIFGCGHGGRGFSINCRLVCANGGPATAGVLIASLADQDACRQSWPCVRALTKSRINCAAAL